MTAQNLPQFNDAQLADNYSSPYLYHSNTMLKQHKSISSQLLSKIQDRVTHYYNKFIAAGFSHSESRCLAEETVETQQLCLEHIQEQIQIALSNTNIATKHDIALLKKDIELVESRLEQKIALVRTEIESVRTEIESVRTEIESVRTEIESVRTEISKASNKTIMWVAGLLVTSGLIEHLFK